MWVFTALREGQRRVNSYAVSSEACRGAGAVRRNHSADHSVGDLTGFTLAFIIPPAPAIHLCRPPIDMRAPTTRYEYSTCSKHAALYLLENWRSRSELPHPRLCDWQATIRSNIAPRPPLLCSAAFELGNGAINWAQRHGGISL